MYEIQSYEIQLYEIQSYEIQSYEILAATLGDIGPDPGWDNLCRPGGIAETTLALLGRFWKLPPDAASGKCFWISCT